MDGSVFGREQENEGVMVWGCFLTGWFGLGQSVALAFRQYFQKSGEGFTFST